MLTVTDIQSIILQGENSAVEFKAEQTRPESIAREMVAFANTGGGVILLGVTDDGRLEGLHNDSVDYEAWVANIARNNVTPALSPVCQVTEIDEKKVAAISVPKGRDKPYQTADGRFYVRVGSTNRTATQQELLRLFQSAGVFHFDSTPVAGTGIANLDLSGISSYFARWDVEDFEALSDRERLTLLINSDIMAETGECTVAGVLCFGVNPARHLPQSGISFAHYAGIDPDAELIDRKQIEGTLGSCADAALATLKSNLIEPSSISGLKRVPIGASLPDKVFRELIVNALIHRDYSISGARIRILMYADRLEFISPGRLPNTVTIEKLQAGVSYARNPVLVKFMENLRYADRLCRGMPMVYKEAKKVGKEVWCAEVGEDFRVVLNTRDGPLPN